MYATIYPANKTDLEYILKLQKECYLSEAEIYNDYEIQPLQQDIHALEKEFVKYTFFKALVSNEIVGSVRGFSDGETCFVGKLIVKNDLQNKGIGKLLLKSVESYFPECKRFELFTGYKSIKNLYLYGKLGYKEFKRDVTNDRLTIIFLEKFR
jgi:GNAT superfamily N-acetyltransferase